MTAAIAPPVAAAPLTAAELTAPTLTASAPLAMASVDEIRARRSSFGHDLMTVAGRALRSIPREPTTVVAAVLVPLFFFVVYVGALQDFSEQRIANFDYKAFQLPVAIIFAVTGVSRAMMLVTDIQNGYFDRLFLTPVRRLSLLLGLMVADFAMVCGLSIPVVALGLAAGVRFETGVLGMVGFVVLAGLWGFVFSGFKYAIALRTGSPAAVGTSSILFFPFAFLSTATLPRESLTGWLGAVAGYNPVTYLLDGLRALVTRGWMWGDIGKALLAVAVVGVISMAMCLAALRGRLSRG